MWKLFNQTRGPSLLLIGNNPAPTVNNNYLNEKKKQQQQQQQQQQSQQKSENDVVRTERRKSISTLVGATLKTDYKDLNHMTLLLAKSSIDVSPFADKKIRKPQQPQQTTTTSTTTINLSSLKKNHSIVTPDQEFFNSLPSLEQAPQPSFSSTYIESNEVVIESSNSSNNNNNNNNNNSNSRFLNDFSQMSVLGKGWSGIVIKAENIYDGIEYAIKRIKVNQKLPTKELMEVRTMARLNHPNIVRYFNSWIEEENQIDHYGESILFKQQQLQQQYDESNNNNNNVNYNNNNNNNNNVNYNNPKYSLYIQMEFCKYGTLRKILNSRTEINLKQSREIVKQVLIGLQYIHAQGVIHRDITPDNIFVCEQPLSVKIGDFGLAITSEALNNQSKQQQLNNNNNSNSNNNNKGVGTFIYSSVEQEEGKHYDEKTDVYSLGVVFYEMLNTFSTNMERIDNLGKLKKSSLVNSIISNLYPLDASFITTLIHAHRPHSNQIPTNVVDFPPSSFIYE
ncbi:hypothetical protein CYY_006385 [Polysphondylium violaceum]|uniref:Protein kinase domain-containing protein n=1 Tax=Polysphondylium violaceum TaxID=133409 RepID=A0A8J4PRZ5_9MYCE|nr:hypothetical protein CYY_006385 [Polysphondylium violaceum]